MKEKQLTAFYKSLIFGPSFTQDYSKIQKSPFTLLQSNLKWEDQQADIKKNCLSLYSSHIKHLESLVHSKKFKVIWYEQIITHIFCIISSIVIILPIIIKVCKQIRNIQAMIQIERSDIQNGILSLQKLYLFLIFITIIGLVNVIIVEKITEYSLKVYFGICLWISLFIILCNRIKTLNLLPLLEYYKLIKIFIIISLFALFNLTLSTIYDKIQISEAIKPVLFDHKNLYLNILS